MQLERVGTISVSGLLLKVARQVDDGQGAKWTFLGKETDNLVKILCHHSIQFNSGSFVSSSLPNAIKNPEKQKIGLRHQQVALKT